MTAEAIINAVHRLGIVRFFPPDADARHEIMEQIRRIVGNQPLYGTTPEQRLDWLINNAITYMSEWKGLPELRGIYCTRWKPADSIEMYCSVPGFTPEDSEMVSARESMSFKAQLTSTGRATLLAAPEGNQMADAEVENPHGQTIGTLIESTIIPALRPANRRSLAEAEREVQEAASRPTLTDAEKVRRLDELRAALGGEAQ